MPDSWKSFGRLISQIEDERESGIYQTQRLQVIVETVAEDCAKKLAALTGISDYNSIVPDVLPQSKDEIRYLHQLYDKLSAWPADVLKQQPVSFVQSILNYRPTDYQVPLVNAYGKTNRITNRWSRQSGKTKTSCAVVLMDCILQPKVRWMVTGPGKRVSDVVMAKMTEFLYEMNPLLQRALIPDPLKTQWNFRNGSSIVATPNAKHALRGDTLNGVLIEEMEFIRDADIVMSSILEPMLATTDGAIIANSTPWDTKSEFARLWCTKECHPERGEHRPDGKCSSWLQLYVPWEQAHRSSIIKDSFVRDTIRPLMEADYGKYVREYLADWSEEVNTYFTSQLLYLATDNDLVYEELELPSWKGTWLIGIDLGEQVDYTGLVALRKAEREIEGRGCWDVAHRKLWPLHTPLAETLGYTTMLYSKMEYCLGCFVDATNNSYFAQDLANHVGVTEGVRFTRSGDNWPQSVGKESFFSYLKTGLRNRRLTMAYDSELYEQMNVEKFELSKDGHYIFSHALGTHDDLLFALGLAWYGTHEPGETAGGLGVAVDL